MFLKRYQDTAIAEELGLSIAAVRKHIQNLCDHFEIEREGDWGKQNAPTNEFKLSSVKR